jgi:hypothetical protein
MTSDISLSLTTLLDAILVLVVLEAVVLGWWSLRRHGRSRAAGLLVNLAAGFFLLLAARAAWVGATAWVLLALLAALGAHLGDLAMRLRRG